MLLKSLILGLIFSLGIFAFKVGLGAHYFLSGYPGSRDKVLFLSGLALGYLLLFLVGYYLIEMLSVSTYINVFQRSFEYGMLLHLLMATLLIVWGILILRADYSERSRSLGWLPLVIPCPLHLSVILLCLVFLLTSFSQGAWISVIGLYLGFLCLVFFTLLILRLFPTRGRQKELLGWGMLFIAAYFFLAIIIMPQFQDAEKIYRLGAYQAEERQVAIENALTAVVLAVIAFTGGVLFRININRRLIK
ncbi:MAG: DUF2162 family putative transporter [Thermodesulfobacteriota bacterium]